jgi:hypothetical protein
MEKETYLEKLKEIEKHFEVSKSNLYREYALTNAKFKIGDTIKDERWAFTIDKITVYKMFDMPEPVYHGFELKKDLTPKKNGNRVTIYGNKAELVRGA